MSFSAHFTETPVELLARESQLFANSVMPQKYFEWITFKRKCTILGLETAYQMYYREIYNNYLKTFLQLHIFITVVHSIAIQIGKEVYMRNPDSTLLDAYIYVTGCALVVSSILLYLRNKLNSDEEKYRYMPHILSWWVCTVMTLSDVLVGFCHYYKHQIKFLRPSYCGYALTTLYLFMPIPSYWPLLLLGVFMSVIYAISFGCVTYFIPNVEKDFLDFHDFLPEIFYIIGLNLVGLGNRSSRDYKTRKFFLTKRQIIEENIILKYAKDQEKNLVMSIIPPQIAQILSQEIKYRIQRSRYRQKLPMTTPNRKLFIEAHNDVTILFADVVNYIHLTTTLDVKTLVETLHDLFQRFDAACLEYNVMRIKFLGDCFYCVAGMPTSHPFHGLCCIELGRSIINHIMEVRNQRNLDINMRIGIHSGNILSGIIGQAKWQYDIWSKDVDIAQRLEHTGLAGRVHISDATLNLVKGFYTYEEGPERAKTDPFLQKQHIKTYIIIEPSEYMTKSMEWHMYKNKNRRKLRNDGLMDMFMANNVSINYADLHEMTNVQLLKELHSLPICKINIKQYCFQPKKRLISPITEDYMARHSITDFWLLFTDWNSSWKYLKQPDETLKSNIALIYVILILVTGSQMANDLHQDIVSFAIYYTFVVVLGLIMVFLTSFSELWKNYFCISKQTPKNKCALLLYNISEYIETNPVLRIFIYILMTALLLSTAFIHLMFCDLTALENDDLLMFEFLEGGKRTLCFNSWAVTDSVVLALGTIFTFVQIPYILQMAIAIPLTIFYATAIFSEFSLVYESSRETNVEIPPEYNHIWNVIIILTIHQLISRHIVYLSKLTSFMYILVTHFCEKFAAAKENVKILSWLIHFRHTSAIDFNRSILIISIYLQSNRSYKWRLQKKIDNAHVTNESIKILLHNILPSHVVKVYLSKRMRNEAYYEQHEYVAVMFATILYPRTGSVELRLLNDIICDFDEVLALYSGPIRVEKIKVANWSYMAACGFKLPARRSGSVVYFQSPVREEIKSSVSVSYASNSGSDADGGESEEEINNYSSYDLFREKQKKDITKVITLFALDLLHSVQAFNRANQLDQGLDLETDDTISLRIGISSGEVMAGIVGQSQAHYDIWGNAVNMASRMDTTGIPGQIHVTEETAKKLKSFNINCKYQGMTFIKGCGSIPTYYVGLTKDLEFERVSQKKN